MSAEDTMTDDLPEEDFTDEDLGLDTEGVEDLIAAAQAGADEIVLDLSEAILPIPAGDYEFVFVDAAKTNTKDGRPMLEVTLKVADVGPFLDRLVKRKFMLVGAGAGFTLPLLEVLGVPYDPATNKVGLSMAYLKSQRGQRRLKAHAVIKDGFNDLSNFEPA